MSATTVARRARIELRKRSAYEKREVALAARPKVAPEAVEEEQPSALEIGRRLALAEDDSLERLRWKALPKVHPAMKAWYTYGDGIFQHIGSQELVAISFFKGAIEDMEASRSVLITREQGYEQCERITTQARAQRSRALRYVALMQLITIGALVWCAGMHGVR